MIVNWHFIQTWCTKILSIAVGVTCCAIEARSELSLLARRPTRIVGGKDAEKGIHPWQVSIHWDDPSRGLLPRHVCGGSLLHAGWILTAGHCKTLSPSKNPGRYLVLAYDIALMMIEEPFHLNPFVATVVLPYPETMPEGNAILTGWGSIGRSRAPHNPEILQSAILPILDYNICKEVLNDVLRHEGRNPLHPTNVCTGPLNGTLSACKGDSGGPLVMLNLLDQVEVVGIVSWGLFPCGGRNAPSVYTRVSAFVPWIHNIVLSNG